MSHIGGTQSPPSDDCHPMGACSIEGGNVGGIPDRQQRSRTYILSFYLRTLSQSCPSEYFDPSEHVQEQTQAQGTTPRRTATDASAMRLGQQLGQQVSSRLAVPSLFFASRAYCTDRLRG